MSYCIQVKWNNRDYATCCSHHRMLVIVYKLNEIIEAMLHAVNLDRMWVILYKSNEIIEAMLHAVNLDRMLVIVYKLNEIIETMLHAVVIIEC